MGNRVQDIIFILLILCVNSCDDSHYTNDCIRIPYTNKEIRIDGDLSDWRNYYTTTFKDTLQSINSPGSYALAEVYPEGFSEDHIPLPLSRNEVTAMLCWNNNALYVGITVIDSHLVAEYIGKADNPNIFLNDGIELYIDTKNDSEGRMDINDYHIIVDILNQQCIFRGDLNLITSDSKLVPKQIGQNIVVETAVKHHGTINDHKLGTHYIVEMKIPFLSIGMQPYEGKIVKIDICNNDTDYLLSELGLGIDELHFTWAFNWNGLGDFGFPDTWQTAVLIGRPSVYHAFSEKIKYSWIFFFGGFALITLLVGGVLLYRIKEQNKLPDIEIINKVIILNQTNIEQTEENDQQRVLTKVTQYIFVNISARITPQEVADEHNISLRSLQRLTKNEFDCTPVALINSVKMQYAKELMEKNKNLSVAEVAYKTGFSDPAYFSKLFKNQFNVTPKNFISGEA